MMLHELFHRYLAACPTRTLRFGQWFLNTYYPLVVDPELYYAGTGTAAEIIKARYLDKL